MKVNTGKSPLALSVLVAILSLSLVVNLPGLAVTPMLGTLSKIFPDTTQLEKQLLTMLPNLLIIPCLLLAGKLSLSHHKITVITVSLIVYSLCGIAYLFATSMVQLIIISCMLGIGAGILIPFSTGLLADTFAGAERMKQMGYQSAISNLTLVVATYAVGLLSHGNWHLPFIVYLIPIIPLALTPLLKKIPACDLYGECGVPSSSTSVENASVSNGKFIVSRLVATIAVYFFVTYSSIVISYYCPFLIEKESWSADIAGIVTAIFFFFTFVPGFALKPIINAFGKNTLIYAVLSLLGGLAMFAFVRQEWAMFLGSALMGFGYGVYQPIIYNKATLTVTSPRKSTLALSIVLVANYTAIALTPVIIDGLRSALGGGGIIAFAFKLNFFLTLAFAIIVVLKRNSFVFRPN
ncbi:MAG: MFS transporter [Paramuribaculum sp.]|nr:MFS transporter [Paramuribaculum sp.]MDE6459776.1 MFS transporter [Paramuribaculum sp.]